MKIAIFGTGYLYNFDFEKHDMTKFMQYDMVFINTLLLYSFAKELSKRKIPVFW